FSKRHERTIKRMSTEARRVLIAHDWPGNVRELSNVIERMVVVDFDGVLDLDDLPPELVEHPAATETVGESGGTPLSNLVGRPLDDVERMFIAETLKFTGGNREEAASMLGIGERTLYRKIDKYHL